LPAQALGDSELLAAVDLGSNSFHLIVASFAQGQLRVVDRLREMVRIAAGLDKGKNLDAASQDRALECLARFGERLRDIPPERLRVVGTNTLRKARNPAEFLRKAEAMLGHDIDVVSGVEEARLIFIGASHSLPEVPGRHMVIDIGGGSTELAGGEGYQPDRLQSLGIGCVGMSRKFFPKGKITRKRFDEARTAVRLELRPYAGIFNGARWERVSGASGTIRTAADVLSGLKLDETGISVPALERLIDAMAEQGQAERLELPGLSQERAPVFAGGIAILTEVMSFLSIEKLVTAQGALREGILYDLVGRLGDEDSRVRTVRAMESRYHVDSDQADRVEQTALSLFEQVADSWKLRRPNAQNLLGWAARLHEIGLDIAHSGHHKHGAYLLEHSDMPGFTRNEQAILAGLVGSHRRRLTTAKVSAVTSAGWGKRTLRLTILLRLAVLFNRSRSYEFPDTFRIFAKGKSITLQLSREWLNSNPLSLADLQCEVDYLESVGFELNIVPAEEVD
jgi:exopolyphosphatase/guanosine-5'-triphosphate,3'-diphosphate pyrophosphatase